MVLGAPGAGQLTSQEISNRVAVPYNHVTKVVRELRALGIIEVARGRAGGATITSKGLSTSIGGLLRHLDKREDVVDCSTRDAATGCPLACGCRLRSALRIAREAFYASLDELTVQDVCETSPALVSLPVPSIRK